MSTMLYWLGVYLLICIAVAIPFLLLYVAGIVFWLALSGLRSVMRNLRDVLEARADFARSHWTAIRRKTA